MKDRHSHLEKLCSVSPAYIRALRRADAVNATNEQMLRRLEFIQQMHSPEMMARQIEVVLAASSLHLLREEHERQRATPVIIAPPAFSYFMMVVLGIFSVLILTY